MKVTVHGNSGNVVNVTPELDKNTLDHIETALQEVYCVKYEDPSVTYEQVKALMDAGKEVVLQYDKMSYARACIYNATTVAFWSMTWSFGIRWYYLSKGGVWSTGHVNVPVGGQTCAVADTQYSPRHYVYWGLNWAANGAVMFCHQGWRASGAKSNSMKAFKAVKTVGWNGIECDLQATSDNKLVCSHDPSFTADDGTKVTIADHTLEDLQTNFVYDGYPPVSLDDLMALCQLYSFKVVLDKSENIYKNEDTIAYVKECIAAHSMWDKTCIPVKYNDTASMESFKTNFSGCSSRVLVQYVATENLETGREQAEQMVTTYGAKNCYISTSPDRYSKDDIIAMTKKFKPGMLLDIWLVNTVARYNEWCDKAAAWTTDNLQPYAVMVNLTNN